MTCAFAPELVTAGLSWENLAIHGSWSDTIIMIFSNKPTRPNTSVTSLLIYLV